MKEVIVSIWLYSCNFNIEGAKFYCGVTEYARNQVDHSSLAQLFPRPLLFGLVACWVSLLLTGAILSISGGFFPSEVVRMNL